MKTEDKKRVLSLVPSVDSRESENEIDLLELGYMLLDQVHYIIFFLLLGALLLNAYAFFGITPTYESTAKLYVVSASKDSVVDLTDLDIGTSLTSDYEELILSYPVLDQVLEGLQLDMDRKQLKSMISLTNPEDTRILAMTVTSTDPQEAADIANKLAEVSVEYLPETMSTNAPNIAQTAEVSYERVNPSYSKYTLLGALLGAILFCGYVTIKYLMNDTIRNMEDMEKYFGIVPLASIPDNVIFDEWEEKAKTYHPNHKKKK